MALLCLIHELGSGPKEAEGPCPPYFLGSVGLTGHPHGRDLYRKRDWFFTQQGGYPLDLPTEPTRELCFLFSVNIC